MFRGLVCRLLLRKISLGNDMGKPLVQGHWIHKYVVECSTNMHPFLLHVSEVASFTGSSSHHDNVWDSTARGQQITASVMPSLNIKACSDQCLESLHGNLVLTTGFDFLS